MTTTKSRLGRADTIFTQTKASKTAAPASTWPSVDNKLTVIIPPDLVAWLDQLCLDIRQKTGGKIRRTEVIRAFVSGIRASKIDLTGCGREEDLAELIEASAKGQKG